MHFDSQNIRSRVRGRCLSGTALCLALALISGGAHAQEGAGSATASEQRNDVDEIVITARRRDETLSQVPIAVTAISGDQLNERLIRTDSDLQLAAPGLTVRQTQGNNSLTYSIRGQTADIFSGSPSAVITYLNEVPLTVAGASSLFDLESVQVLKAPQGTLFGRNATGGAVLFTSAKPTDKHEALARIRVGNLDLREIEAMVNVPLADDRVMVRAAANVVNRDGYVTNLLTGEDLGEIDRRSARLSVTVQPTETIENTTVLQYSDINGTNTGASYTYSVYAPGQTNNGFTLNSGSGLLFDPGLDAVFQFPGAWDAYLAANPDAFAPGLLAYVDEQRRIGPYNTRHPGPADHDAEDLFLSNITEIELGENLQLRNIVGYASGDVDSVQPQLGAPFVTIATANFATGDFGNEFEFDSISEELQLLGEVGNLSYIAGIYLQKMESDTVWPQTYFDLSPILAPATTTNAFRAENKTSAVYAQGTYDLSSMMDGLAVTGGVRYTREEVDFAVLPRDTRGVDTIFFDIDGDGVNDIDADGQSETFEDPGWEVGLEYQVTPQLFTYVKHRGSFRSGGFNGAALPVNATATGGGNIFDSEHTKDIEAGVKYRGEAFDRPLLFNANIYNQWITDVQRVEFPPDPTGASASIAVTANVPKAVVRGVEADGSFMPTEWLELGGFVSFTDAEYKDGEVNLFGSSFIYGPVADTPELSGVAYGQVFLPVDPEFGELSLRAEVYSQSEMYFANAADTIAPDTKLPGYTLVSGALRWESMFGSNLNTTVFAKNITEEEYFAGGMTLAAALGHNAAAVGEPRTFGVELDVRF